LLGLGARAGTIVVGTGGVRAALRRGELALVVVAADGSARTEDKVVRLAQAMGVPVVRGPDSADLGRLVGRGVVQAVGVKDRWLAAGVASRRQTAEPRRR
jgi:ribosomal protein L7Ae-like RNA K-turn-binding protein